MGEVHAIFTDDAIVVNILKRLPARGLMNCRLVNKKWNGIVSGMALNCARLDIAASSSEVIIQYQTGSFNIIDTEDNQPYWPVKVSKEYFLPDQCFSLIGSSNGIICIFDRERDHIYVTNPMLGEYFGVPELLSRSGSKYAFGFGCYIDNNAYKILRIKKQRMNSVAEVYSLGSDHWKNVGNAPFPLDRHKRLGAVVNGMMHWIVDDDGIPEFICSFHVKDETFNSVPPPKALKQSSRKTMIVESIQNTLYLVFVSNSYLQIYCMKEYGNGESWTQSYKISKKIIPNGIGELHPVTILKDKQILFSARKGHLVSYNPTKNCFSEAKISGMESGLRGVSFQSSFLTMTGFENPFVKQAALGKKVKAFGQTNYWHNFIQSTFNALSVDFVRGATLVVSSDGHKFSKDAIQIIIKMAAANGVRHVWVGHNGLLSTPAASTVIRERIGSNGSKPIKAFILTATHNPGGPKDLGIKYNTADGGPAPEGIADKILENARTIKEYLIAKDLLDVDISTIGITNIEGPEGQFDVDVFDSASDQVK
ncbi:F-box protein At3g07870-like [Cornus florida]|uniref:F-box protein At3g07870-like n=1 Tax=Cornus florida TaxID=4283 RepID=UPI00289F7B1A|nr:F-box protein At3g07870-like [Cornus florida]